MIKPMGDKIVIDVDEVSNKTESGIYIPTTASKEKSQQGKVIAVGPGRILENGNRAPIDVNVGDIIVFSKFSGTELKVGDKSYLVISERDIIAAI